MKRQKTSGDGVPLKAMKYRLLCLLFLLILCFPVANAQSFVISGKTNGYIPNGSILYLTRWNGMGPIVFFTSTVVQDGTFCLRGEVTGTSDLVYLYGTEKAVGVSRLRLWLSNDTTKVLANSEEPSTWIVESKIPKQTEENQYSQLKGKDNLQKFGQLNSRQLWDKSLSLDSIRILSNQMIQIALPGELSVLECLNSQPELTDVGLVQLFFICGYSSYITDMKHLQMAKAVYSRLSEAQKQTYYGKMIKTRFFPDRAPDKGDGFIDAELKDLEGNTYKLSDFLHKGKYILLDFWDQNCAPCVKSVPGLKELAASCSDKLTIISVNVGNRYGWEKGSSDFSWLSLSDGQGMVGIASRYGVRSIPYFVLITPNGIIKNYWRGYKSQSTMEKEIISYLCE